ncbi:permease [Cellulomonas sp. NPDC057328]|uniref:permease n=1 Tax=Cellulomonas sp. NPDC057328 TaxID=3346101 RepID=UPI003638DA9A
MRTVWSETTWLTGFVVDVVVELAPWFLLAIVLGVLVQHLDLDMLATRGFARNGVLGVLTTAAIGALSPFCSFTVIPLISRLLRAGVPLSAIMAFWIASPAMDPEIYALSAAALGVEIATARLVGALLLSVGAGLVVLALERRGRFADPLRPSVAAEGRVRTGGLVASTAAPARAGAATVATPATPTPAATTAVGPPADAPACAPACGTDAADADPWSDDDGRPWRTVLAQHARRIDRRRFLRDIVHDLHTMGRWLLLAIVVMAVIVRYVPESVVTAVLGAQGWTAIPVAGVVATPLYLNGVGAIPVVQGLLLQGMLPAAAVTFLLAGATTTVPAMVAVRSVVRWRVFGFYLAAAFLGSMLVGLLALPWL